MRTYYRASGGVDGAIQTLLFWVVIVSAPVWVPIAFVVLLVTMWHEAHPSPKPPICATLDRARDTVNANWRYAHTPAGQREAIHLTTRLQDLGCWKR